MNFHNGHTTAYDVDDEDEDIPPLQRWLRVFWIRTKQDYYQGKRDVTIFIQRFWQRPEEMTKWTLRRFAQKGFSTAGLLIAIWLLVLYHGEARTFDSSISRCDWSKWERWPLDAHPHRLVFVADPQLVDPHTYPGRPWPLSTLTVKHSDLYMRRSYSRIQQDLVPDTIIFLGDLFDGGREWSTATSDSPEERFRGYGEAFWQKEYGRFSKIFLRDWRKESTKRDGAEKAESPTRIIASLPGNHDLGFGRTIQLPVRERFNAFFGDSNRIDVIGNHTFVSVDTVSLSAIDDDRSDPAIWRPAYEFLENARTLRSAAVEKHLRHIDEISSNPSVQPKHLHDVEDIERRVAENEFSPSPQSTSPEIPTILLSHVPLGRPLGKPCGPLREHWPPTIPPEGQKERMDPDERNSLPSQGRGWQYQNSLSTRVSQFITENLEGSISYAFSGDDHDFCEIVHQGYSSPGTGIKEITTKSLSWTMGVRKPGFLLVSLWNELDSDGRSVQRIAEQETGTIHTHLCLLPDQLLILIRYGILLGASLILLALQATYNLYLLQSGHAEQRGESTKPLLPTSDYQASSAELEKTNGHHTSSMRLQSHSQASSSSSDDALLTQVSSRNAGSTRPRSVSPMPSYGFNADPLGTQPLVAYATNRPGWQDTSPSEALGWGAKRSTQARKRQRVAKRSAAAHFGVLFAKETWHVARIVLVWYLWLLYT